MCTIHIACVSSIGRKRANNEDNFCFGAGRKYVYLPEQNDGSSGVKESSFPDTDHPFMGVFDGMGGYAGGEKAAHIAAMMTASSSICDTDDFQNKMYLANKSILRAAEICKMKDMGCTSAFVSFLEKGKMIIGNIGDSRIYQMRDGGIVQLSVDHISKSHCLPWRKPPLSQCLGISEKEFVIRPFAAEMKYQENDLIICCSDGLTDIVDDETILDIAEQGRGDIHAVVDSLLQEALDMGGYDNITITAALIKP